MRRIAALAVVLAVLAGGARASAEFLGRFVWDPGFEGAGGYSGLWLAPGGDAFVAISDRAGWVRGNLSRGGSGAVGGVEITDRGRLLGPEGGPLARKAGDSEDVTFADGAFYISFEGSNRILRYDDLAKAPARFRQPREFAKLQDNSGLEALAADAGERLYAIPERSGAWERPFPVYRFDGESWSVPFEIPREGRFLVSGADIGPDGRLYVLERDFALIGFRTRVRSFDLAGGGERVELETTIGTHDNLEGIDVWEDPSGRLRLTMISDDNQRPLIQRTEFVDYVLD